jgi:hypothetical protein
MEDGWGMRISMRNLESCLIGYLRIDLGRGIIKVDLGIL